MLLCTVHQRKKYTGAAGEFALEMPKRAPEIVQKCAYGGDIKTGNRPRNNFPLPSEKQQGARWIRELASVAGPTSARSLTSRSSALHGMAPYPTEVHQLQSQRQRDSCAARTAAVTSSVETARLDAHALVLNESSS